MEIYGASLAKNLLTEGLFRLLDIFTDMTTDENRFGFWPKNRNRRQNVGEEFFFSAE